MKHFFTTRVKVVLIVAVLLAVALAVISDLSGLSLQDMVVKGVLTPIRSGASRVADGAEQIYNYIFGYESLAAENEALKEQLAALEDEARRADSMDRENSYLRSVIGLKENNPSWELE